MQNICLPITGNQIERTCNTNGFFVKVDCKHIVTYKICFFRNTLRSGKAFAFWKSFFATDIFPYFENTMDSKARTTTSGIDYFVIDGWVHHFYAHINDITRSEILALFTFLSLTHQVFKCIVYNIKIIVKQLYILKCSYADGKMRRREKNLALVSKDTLPFFLCIVKETLNFLFQFEICFT